MNPKCPHCGKAIELVGPAELQRDFGISPNSLQHARERNIFPEPWMSFSNRNVYLSTDISEFVSERGRAKIDRTIKDVLSTLASLPDGEAEEVERLLAAKLKDGLKPRA